MHWKIKATIQNAVSFLPPSFSYASYYFLQRHFGGLRNINPMNHFASGLETWKRIKSQGIDPAGKTFFEVGTGRAPIVPIAFWLMGARNTVTVDLNPYMKSELVKECLEYVRDNQKVVRDLFGQFVDEARLGTLLRFMDNRSNKKGFLEAFLKTCGIHYIAPGDATMTKLSRYSINFHTSNNVLEHIPPEILKRIFEEGNRIIKPNGLFVHRIDYSDHFAHSDPGITPINFLQYNDKEWERYAGNRYMYMNRLRHDDFIDLFRSVGHSILSSETSIHDGAFKLLESGAFKVEKRFENKSNKILATTESWLVSCLSTDYAAIEACALNTGVV